MRALQALDNPACSDSDKRLGWPRNQRNPCKTRMRFAQMLCAFDQPKRAGFLRAKGDDHVV
jgi:hypothetical protein